MMTQAVFFLNIIKVLLSGKSRTGGPTNLLHIKKILNRDRALLKHGFMYLPDDLKGYEGSISC